jgi:hypothetical protein
MDQLDYIITSPESIRQALISPLERITDKVPQYSGLFTDIVCLLVN